MKIFLGKALLEYEGFEEYGVKIDSDFDFGSDDFESEFLSYVKNNDIKIGIIAVDKTLAQYVCDKMIETGIIAVWNLAPCSLKVPYGICLRQENLALSLAYLQNQSAE